MSFKKHIVQHKFKPGNRLEWLKLRNLMTGEGDPNTCRFGGSDIAACIGMSKYREPYSLYYERIGAKPVNTETNAHMYRGITTEEIICRAFYQHFDPREPTTDRLISNAENKNVVRTARRVNSLVYNPRYPHLFANVDFEVPSCKIPNLQHGRRILEIKNMLWSSMDTWESGIDPSYVVQLQTYMTVCEIPEGEIFVLRDGTVPYYYVIQSDPELEEEIIAASEEMAARVISAKQEIAQVDKANSNEYDAIVDRYAPEPEYNKQYIKFMKEIYKPENEDMWRTGDEALLDQVIAFLRLKEQKKELEGELEVCEAHIRERFWEKDENGKRAVAYKWEGIGQIKWVKKLSTPAGILKNYNSLTQEQ